MANKFSNVCLIPYNGMLLLQKVLRQIRWELYRGGGRYPEVSMEIVFFKNPKRRELDGKETTHVFK